MVKNTVTLKDIANRLGISEATVSLAINDRPGVKAHTKEMVLACAEEMGYVPNILAQGLAGQKSYMIGIVIPTFDNYFYCSLAKKIESYIKAKGYNIIFATSDNQPAMERKVVESFISYHVEGIIIFPTNNQNGDLDILLQHDTPCLTCGSYYKDMDIPYVISDLESGSYDLIHKLFLTGSNRIVLLGGEEKTVMVKKRLDGITRAYKTAGIPLEQFRFIPTTENTFETAYRETIKLIKKQPVPDVIIALNDYMALGVLKALEDCGLNVPADIQLAEYDDALMVEMAATPITSVAQDIEAMGQHVSDILFQKIGGINNNSKMELATHLIMRRSTKQI